MVDEAKALLAEVEEQEAALRFPHFTHEDAWQLAGVLTDLVRTRGLAVAVDIRRGAQQVFHAAFAGTTADNDDWIERKNATVRRFDKSSLAVRLQFTGRDPKWLDPTVYALAGGCVPVKVDGLLAGTVTVSGLPDTEDHAVVVEAMRAYLGQ